MRITNRTTAVVAVTLMATGFVASCGGVGGRETTTDLALDEFNVSLDIIVDAASREGYVSGYFPVVNVPEFSLIVATSSAAVLGRTDAVVVDAGLADTVLGNTEGTTEVSSSFMLDVTGSILVQFYRDGRVASSARVQLGSNVMPLISTSDSVLDGSTRETTVTASFGFTPEEQITETPLGVSSLVTRCELEGEDVPLQSSRLSKSRLLSNGPTLVDLDENVEPYVKSVSAELIAASVSEELSSGTFDTCEVELRARAARILRADAATSGNNDIATFDHNDTDAPLIGVSLTLVSPPVTVTVMSDAVTRGR